MTKSRQLAEQSRSLPEVVEDFIVFVRRVLTAGHLFGSHPRLVIAVMSWKVKVFASDDAAVLGVLQSQAHDLWSLREGATTGETPAYSGTKCFDTFALPLDSRLGLVRDVTTEYIGRRETYRERQGLGLTGFYGSPRVIVGDVMRAFGVVGGG